VRLAAPEIGELGYGPDNAASTRLLERLRFVREGVLRSYRGEDADRVSYSLLRDAVAAP
jgi:RimJ/RimL family protein N-acetyltransferase